MTRRVVAYVSPPSDSFNEFMVEVSREDVVRFTDQTRAYLNPADPDLAAKRSALTFSQVYLRPVYVAIDGDNVIKDVVIPEISRVVGLREEGPHHISVRFAKLPVPYRVDRTRPENDIILKLLRDSLDHQQDIIVVDNPEEQRLLGVALLPTPEHLDLFGVGSPASSYQPVFGHAAVARTGIVDGATLHRLFGAIAAEACDAAAGNGECIPFRYPYNGCVVRAHRMCEILEQHGYTAGKIWVYAPLESELLVRTPNVVGCELAWHFHVAAFGRVAESEVVIFDQSLFPHEAVSEAAWIGSLGNAKASVRYSDPSCYELSAEPDRGRPPNFSRNEISADLEIYRNALQRRIAEVGPPPYSC